MRMSALPLVLTAAAFAATAASAQNAKYTAPGAGEVQVKYGTPTWREELFKQASPGSFWRLGSGGATSIDTQAAIVAKEGVIFPGTYNLNARIGSPDDWALLFHKDGTFYKDGPKLALFSLKKGEMAPKDKLATRLNIEIEAAKEPALKSTGGATFRVRFGPHTLEGSFRFLGVQKKHVAAGPASYNLETVKLPAAEEFQVVWDGKGPDNFTFARVVLDNDKGATLLAIGPGDEPVLKLVDFGREVKGTRTQSSSPEKSLKFSLESEHLKFQLGATVLDFPFGTSLLSKTEPGATTPKKPGG